MFQDRVMDLEITEQQTPNERVQSQCTQRSLSLSLLLFCVCVCV